MHYGAALVAGGRTESEVYGALWGSSLVAGGQPMLHHGADLLWQPGGQLCIMGQLYCGRRAARA